MTVEEVINEIKAMGNERTKATLMKHGAKEPFYGVKTGDLKKIQKKIKKDHELSLQLYDSGVSDAMYLAGLIADKEKITPEHLQHWIENATWYMISEYTVPWIAADSGHGIEMGIKWIESEEEMIASAGWSALSNAISIAKDEDIDVNLHSNLLDRVQKQLQSSQNRVRYTMNGYVIAVGSYIPGLTDKAKKVADSIGKVNVDMGGTACKVPDAPSYIAKIESMGRIGKKRKMARC
ncbi:MAG: DNA alkylation repair protein [Saprospiraceae bacterium]|nr:DNA alkylation repair protein [Saprospiraceae bacterium]